MRQPLERNNKMPRSFLIRKILGLDDGHNDDNNSEILNSSQLESDQQTKATAYRKGFHGIKY